jgi:hypothetical protein
MYYEGTDMILNLYGNHTPKLDYALSNKLYYSASLGMPILVCPDTYMAEIIDVYELGLIFDKNDPQNLNKLYAYYSNIDRNEFLRKCDYFLHSITNDMEQYKKIIRLFGILA